MPIKLDCPRCKTPLQVPSKLAGGYVNCPHCKGRLWVSKDAAAERTPSAPLAEPPLGKSAAPVEGSSSAPAMPDLPRPPAPRKKVARFISAETADSTLQLAADGKLPELRLEEGADQRDPQAKSSSMNPLFLLGLLSISVLLSIVLAMIGPKSPTDSHGEKKEQQRYLIEREYFGAGNIDNRALEPYQVLLREAQRAYTRGDYKAAREHYRRVLNMLRAERGAERRGLTGSRWRDKQLEEAISVLLSGE